MPRTVRITMAVLIAYGALYWYALDQQHPRHYEHCDAPQHRYVPRTDTHWELIKCPTGNRWTQIAAP
jgi:hypothetical protein